MDIIDKVKGFIDEQEFYFGNLFIVGDLFFDLDCDEDIQVREDVDNVYDVEEEKELILFKLGLLIVFLVGVVIMGGGIYVVVVYVQNLVVNVVVDNDEVKWI